MTPQDIATNVSAGKFGSVNTSVQGTNSYCGMNLTVDDWNTWD